MMEIPDTVLQRPSPVEGRIALIDADIMIYSCSFACQTTLYDLYYCDPKLRGIIESFTSKREMNQYIEDYDLVGKVSYEAKVIPSDLYSLRVSIKSMFDTIMFSSSSSRYEMYISEGASFRAGLAVSAPYKGNRPDKPYWYHTAKEVLIDEYKANTCGILEADDCLGIRQTKLNGYGIICSIDKDLLQVPGLHYNIGSQYVHKVSDEEAWRSLFKQALMGDTVDNIKGCKGIGKVKAEKLIGYCLEPSDAYHISLTEYMKVYGGDEGLAKYHETFSLVYTLRGHDDDWKKGLEGFGVRFEA